MLKWIGQLICGISGHSDVYLIKGPFALGLKCTNCLRETRGWRW